MAARYSADKPTGQVLSGAYAAAMVAVGIAGLIGLVAAVRLPKRVERA